MFESDQSSDQPTQQPSARQMRILGVHHVTLISRNLETTTAFYRDLLGLPLLDAGTSHDDASARHFQFGHAVDGQPGVGQPGTILTFLEYPLLPVAQEGVGGVHHLSLYVASADELEAWRNYLQTHGVECSEILERGTLNSIYFRDPDGQLVELASV